MSGVLAERYASDQMRKIWSRENKISLERDLWIMVMKAQSSVGFSIDKSVISEYERVKSTIDLIGIDKRERVLKHDVKARIEEFNFLAGHQLIHLGMTSRDLTENVELFQIKTSLEVIEKKALSFLYRLGEKSLSHIDSTLVARTHNVPAQVTTLGKRFATWAEELIFAINHLRELQKRLPLRGIKGAVGTSQDAIDLLGSSQSGIDQEITKALGFETLAISSSQIYPRSIDLEILATLVQLSAAASNMATNIRLMSGNGLVSEGLKSDQVGSSAMPHKVNSRLSERLNGLVVVLKGYALMISEISGNQWNEGDVSCSVVRRVALPDSFYATDAILDTAINIVINLQINEDAISAELKANLPFMLSSKILMLCVKAGIGREEAHEIIKKHALTASTNLRRNGENNFIELVSSDPRLGLDKESLIKLLETPLALTGDAKGQVERILAEVSQLIAGSDEVTSYLPGEML
jgi:adenylosuccinate lyase